MDIRFVFFSDNFSILEREQLIDISWDRNLMIEFKKENLCTFWLKGRNEYKFISDNVINF